MNYKFIFFLLLFNSIETYSQTLYRMNNVPIYHDSKLLKSPFTGGMNNSIINQMDLNNDGKMDLVIVQQVQNIINRIQTYINNGAGNYTYTPRYEAFFPKKHNAFFQLKDLNEDKVEDIIYKTSLYFLIYYGSRVNDSTIAFSFYDTLESISYDPLYGTQHIAVKNLYLPVFRDLDSDGDIDIVYVKAGALNSDERYYYKNYKKEKSLPANQNEFYNENKYFGQNSFSLNPLKFINGAYTKIAKGEKENPDKNLRPRHDEYQMIWELDINNDGLYDACAYSENQRNAPLAINIGTKDSAFLAHHETYFPNTSKPISKLMSSGFWLDIDNDAKKDILVSAMIERDNSGTQLKDKLFNDDINTISFYKNYGPKKNPESMNGKFNDSFIHITDSFLALETVDVGTGSQPCFYNYDQDSLIDILIPNIMKRDSWEVSTIAYYRNIGSKSQPQYKLMDLDLFNYKSKNRANIKLATGDLNNDGKEDLLTSSYDVIKNGPFASSPNTEISFEVIYNFGSGLYTTDKLNIDYSNKIGRANCCIFDVNKDGKQDLFIGDLYSIKYYQNMGSATSPLFNQITCDSVIRVNDIYNYPTDFNFYPAVWKDPMDNKDYLLFAYHFDGGKIGKARIDTAKLNQNLPLDTISTNLYPNFSINYYPTIQIKDITNDGKSEIVFGNYAGGLQIFSFDSLTGALDPPPPPPPPLAIHSVYSIDKIQLYPNPTQNIVNIQLPDLKSKYELEIYTIEGKMVKNLNINSKTESINIDEFQNGIYFFKFINQNLESQVIKISKISP